MTSTAFGVDSDSVGPLRIATATLLTVLSAVEVRSASKSCSQAACHRDLERLAARRFS